MRLFNDACKAVAQRHGVSLLDGFDHPAAGERDTYADDGFHPSAEGHRRAAAAFLRALRKRFRLTELPAMTFEKSFDALEIGERFETAGRTVSDADIASFAELTGDMHPQHTDAEWAAESRFGERIAHGLLVLSWASGLMPFDPDRIVALRRIGDAVFKAPVLIGDTVHVEGRSSSAREIDDENGLVECRWKVAQPARQAGPARLRRVGLAARSPSGNRY